MVTFRMKTPAILKLPARERRRSGAPSSARPGSRCRKVRSRMPGHRLGRQGRWGGSECRPDRAGSEESSMSCMGPEGRTGDAGLSPRRRCHRLTVSDLVAGVERVQRDRAGCRRRRSAPPGPSGLRRGRQTGRRCRSRSARVDAGARREAGAAGVAVVLCWPVQVPMAIGAPRPGQVAGRTKVMLTSAPAAPARVKRPEPASVERDGPVACAREDRAVGQVLEPAVTVSGGLHGGGGGDVGGLRLGRGGPDGEERHNCEGQLGGGVHGVLVLCKGDCVGLLNCARRQSREFRSPEWGRTSTCSRARGVPIMALDRAAVQKFKK